MLVKVLGLLLVQQQIEIVVSDILIDHHLPQLYHQLLHNYGNLAIQSTTQFSVVFHENRYFFQI